MVKDVEAGSCGDARGVGDGEDELAFEGVEQGPSADPRVGLHMAVKKAAGAAEEGPGVVVLLNHIKQDDGELHTKDGAFGDDAV
jgi:hypothetical protein